MWKVATTGEFDVWFRGLDEPAQVELIAKVRLLEVLGPQLGRPHADTLKGSRYGNMKELRADTRDSVMRVAFAFDPTRAAILLLGGNKTGVSQRRFYKQLIDKADDLYGAHLEKVKAAKKAANK
jgi:hypothetical protein